MSELPELYDWLDANTPGWRFWNHYSSCPLSDERHGQTRRNNANFVLGEEGKGRIYERQQTRVWVQSSNEAMLLKLSWEDSTSEPCKNEHRSEQHLDH